MTFFRCLGDGGAPIPTKTPYVASTGNQYLTLPFYCDDYPVIKAKLMTISAYQQVIIGDTSWDVSGFIFYCDGNFNNLYLRYSNNGITTINNAKWCDPVEVEIDYSTGDITYDGTNYTGSPKTQLHNPITLFGNPNNRQGFCFLFSLQVYTNDNLVMNLVPMKDSQTGVGYLHDTIGGQDYYSGSSSGLLYGEI